MIKLLKKLAGINERDLDNKDNYQDQNFNEDDKLEEEELVKKENDDDDDDEKKLTEQDDEYEEDENNNNNEEEEDEEEEEEEEDKSKNEKYKEENEDEWINNNSEEEEEGQLSIDVYQTPKNLVIKSTIAGIQPENVDICINNDILTIKGKREEKNNVQDQDYLYRECYWGSFSRSIILPMEVKANKVNADLENGILTITLPKAKPTKEISIKVNPVK